MNELDFVSMTLGNHEYDWGEEFIEANAELAEFPLLAINVYDKDTNKRADYCDASVMVEVDGIKIGIIGAIGDCYSSIASDKRDGVYFKVGTQLTELVKAESKSLRERGADVIIYSLHDGYGKSVSGSNGVLTGSMSDSYYDMELSRGGYVDIVFEGHSHQSYALKDTAGVYHIQGGGDNSGICHAKLEINFARNEAQTLSASSLSDGSYKHYAEDELIDKLLEKYKDELALANKVLGTNSHKRYSNELKQKVAELYCELGLKTWGAEYDIVLGGGYLNTRSPYNLDAGEVRYSDLQSLLPFDNAIVLCSIKGSDLKRRFTETDNDTYYVSYSEYGASIRYNIDPNATYYIITDSYCSTYAANRLTEIARYDDSTFARDLLAKYIEDGGYS